MWVEFNSNPGVRFSSQSSLRVRSVENWLLTHILLRCQQISLGHWFYLLKSHSDICVFDEISLLFGVGITKGRILTYEWIWTLEHGTLSRPKGDFTMWKEFNSNLGVIFSFQTALRVRSAENSSLTHILLRCQQISSDICCVWWNLTLIWIQY